MTWRDRLPLDGKGSFRGFEFLIGIVKSSVGRRTVTHEFPDNDLPFVEDLGRQPRRITFNAFLVGENYDNRRNELIQAFEEPGQGQLIHPYLGEMTVTIDGPVEFNETTDEGAMTRITFKVIESGEFAIRVEADTAGEVNEAANEAAAANIEEFETEYSVVGAIGAIVQAATNAINEITSTMNQIQGRISAVLNVVDSIGSAIESFADGLAAIINLPGTIASTLSNLQNSVYDAIGTIQSAAADLIGSGGRETAPVDTGELSKRARVELLMESVRDQSVAGAKGEITGTTSQELIEAGNQAAIYNLGRVAAVIEASRVLSRLEFESRDQALEIRNEMIDLIDSLSQNVGDQLFGKLVNLKARLSAHLKAAAQDLPFIRTHTPNETLPALLLAYLLYGDINREGDIIDRNRITHPGFLAGSQPLEVISE